MLRFTISLLAACVFMAGCAAPRAARPTTDDPADPDAPAGDVMRPRTSLRADALTQKSRRLLSAAARDQEEWDRHGPVSGTPTEGNVPSKSNSMPGMSTEAMKGMK